jgi:hypothetical protein
VVDVVDSLLERADTALDEFTGAVKRLSPAADVQVRAERHQCWRFGLTGVDCGKQTTKDIEDRATTQIDGHGEASATFRKRAYE